MSDAYERERQNNSRLDELSAKVSALRGVTIDIYDNARDQGVIDSTVRLPYPCINAPTQTLSHTHTHTRTLLHTLVRSYTHSYALFHGMRRPPALLSSRPRGRVAPGARRPEHGWRTG